MLWDLTQAQRDKVYDALRAVVWGVQLPVHPSLDQHLVRCAKQPKEDC